MLSRHLSLTLCAGLVLSSCVSRAFDSQIVGSWYYAPSVDDQSGVTYAADHSFVIWSEEGKDRREMMFGRWRNEDGQVVMDYKESWASRQIMKELHQDFVPFQRRDSIGIIRSLKPAK